MSKTMENQECEGYLGRGKQRRPTQIPPYRRMHEEALISGDYVKGSRLPSRERFGAPVWRFTHDNR